MKAICLAGGMNSGKSTVAIKMGKALAERGYVPMYVHLGTPIKLNAEILSSEDLACNEELKMMYVNGWSRQDGARIEDFEDYDRAMRNQVVNIEGMEPLTLGELMQGLGESIHKTGHDFLVMEALNRFTQYVARFNGGHSGLVDLWIPAHRGRLWDRKKYLPEIVLVIDGVRYDEEIELFRTIKMFERVIVVSPVRDKGNINDTESRSTASPTETGLKEFGEGSKKVIECGDRTKKDIHDSDVMKCVRELEIIWEEYPETGDDKWFPKGD